MTSTNDVALRMSAEGSPEGTVVVAGEQTAGKGRHGRTWSSPPGEGLYLSLLLRPDLLQQRLGEIAFVSSVASALAIKDASGLPTRIKWPNDILVSDRKVCGILVEARPSTINHQPSTVSRQPLTIGHSVVVGIGVNVNNQSFPPEISATSIALELGRPIPMQEVEDALLAQLVHWYQRFQWEGVAVVMAKWKELDATVGRSMEVRVGDEIISGTAVDVDPGGNLIVELPDGRLSNISAGEVLLPTDSTV